MITIVAATAVGAQALQDAAEGFLVGGFAVTLAHMLTLAVASCALHSSAGPSMVRCSSAILRCCTATPALLFGGSLGLDAATRSAIAFGVWGFRGEGGGGRGRR